MRESATTAAKPPFDLLRARAYPDRILRKLGAVGLALASLLAPLSARADFPPPEGKPHIHLTLAAHPPRTLVIDVATLFHTLVEDFYLEDDATVYVQTGDIPSMWLRDSSNQSRPYVRFIPAVPRLDPLIRGVIERNAKNVLTDPYANAFTAGYRLWEEKWEVDSLAFPVTLAWAYWQTTGNHALFTPRLRWAFEHTVATYECEQHHFTCSRYRSRFLRNSGFGAYYAQTQMIWGAFRPSDDPVRYPFNIPQNMLAAVALDELADLAAVGYGDTALARRARLLALQIRDSIGRYGLVYDFRRGWILAYEVDGYGNHLLMDDANMPNLLSAAYIGFLQPDDPIYLATRDFVLSPDDPYYYRGAYAVGLGSSHTPTGWVWPMGMMMRALSAASWPEVALTLAQLRASGGAEALFHESIDPDRPWRFTRTEFGWANALYAQLIFRSVAGLRPIEGSAPTPQFDGALTRWRNAALVYQACSRIASSL